jgi:hypothetical protein
MILMKILRAYLFIVLSLSLITNIGANSEEVYVTLSEKCKSFDKGDINWHYNNCDQLLSSKKNNEPLKSAFKINKKEKVKYLGQSGYDLGYFYTRAFKINDLRDDGVVYYKFEVKTGNAGWYYRLNKDHEVISKGNFQYKKDKIAFELIDDNNFFLWKVSTASEIVDINSEHYDYKGYRRYQYVEAEEDAQNKIYSSIKNFEEAKYVKVGSKKNNISSFGYEIAKKYDDSDDNLNKLWNLILEDKNIKKKYLKYSKKKAKIKGKPIKSMGLAVFIDYKKELSIITEDKNLKRLSSPISWGWEYSHKDQTVFDGFEAIRNCYKSVRKKKLSLTDGECVLVDFRRITDDSQYPVTWLNYLIETKKNRILLAKDSEKFKQQITGEKVADRSWISDYSIEKRIAGEKVADKSWISDYSIEKRITDEKVAEKKRITDEKVAEKKRITDEKVAEEKRITDEKVAEEKRITDEKVAEEKKLSLIPVEIDLEFSQQFLENVKAFIKLYPDELDIIKVFEFILITRPITDDILNDKLKEDLKLFIEFTNSSDQFVKYITDIKKGQ